MSLSELLSAVRARPLPQHVAVIMDGNGRWAKARGLSRTEGHRQGALVVERLTRFVGEERLFPYLTVFAFSTENWGRPKEELEFLFALLDGFIRDKLGELAARGVRLRVLGAVDRLPASLRRTLAAAVEETKGNDVLHLSVALNFGGRWEIVEGVKRAMAMAREGKATALSEDAFRKLLPTAELPDPDLIIRSGGEQRLSNFFLWGAAYAELYFTPTLWPDFDEEVLLRAIHDFQGRKRNFGRVTT
ncbi:MAG: polyprenyl diphosphate synthase [Candidatus Acetothermia bacterium]|nr:polyprenyl diphosphate synthase [Candidatus Acetothermia bacterium]